MPINYDVEYPKLQRLAEDRKYEVERLIADCEMKDKRIDWTVADNAKKAIEIDRLQARVKALEDACRTMDKTQIAIALAATEQGEVKTNDL